MKQLFLIIFSVFVAFNINAQDLDSYLFKANELYTQGQYQEAINEYNKILDLGYESAEVYYNIGNAYYKEKVIAYAILNYEKAIQLAPNDEDILYNLELANRLVIDKIEVLPVFFITGWIRSLKTLFSSDMWSIIGITCFILMLSFVSFFLYSRNTGFKKISFGIAFFMSLIFIVSIVFSYQQKQSIIKENTAIITIPSVTVKSSPDDSGTDLFVLHEGTKVWIDDKISDWNEIKLSDGSIGWLKSEDIEII